MDKSIVMKRETLFRGKRVDNGEWVVGSLINQPNGSMFIWTDGISYKNIIQVIPETVGQFTGLCDKNGKKIFEGDIVNFKRKVADSTGNFITTLHKIIFSNETSAFVIEAGGIYIKLKKYTGYEYEVICNIHDNPELLTNG